MFLLFMFYLFFICNLVPTSCCCWASFTPVPECIVVGLLETSFPDPPRPPGPRCYYSCCWIAPPPLKNKIINLCFSWIDMDFVFLFSWILRMLFMIFVFVHECCVSFMFFVFFHEFCNIDFLLNFLFNYLINYLTNY